VEKKGLTFVGVWETSGSNRFRRLGLVAYSKKSFKGSPKLAKGPEKGAQLENCRVRRQTNILVFDMSSEGIVEGRRHAEKGDLISVFRKHDLFRQPEKRRGVTNGKQRGRKKFYLPGQVHYATKL